MKDEILSYWEMCARQGMSLQRGMYFKPPPGHGVILMSRWKNAPYEDAMSHDESTLIYEGHDFKRAADVPDPKTRDQPRQENGRPTHHGLFADWADRSKKKQAEDAIFRAYEKLETGIWTDRGLFHLKDYDYVQSGLRKVFKFRCEQAGFDSVSRHESTTVAQNVSRQIPSWV